MGTFGQSIINVVTVLAAVFYLLAVLPEKKSMQKGLLMFLGGALVYVFDIVYLLNWTDCNASFDAGLGIFLTSIESCIDSYDVTLVLAQVAIISGALIMLFSLLIKRYKEEILNNTPSDEDK